MLNHGGNRPRPMSVFSDQCSPRLLSSAMCSPSVSAKTSSLVWTFFSRNGTSTENDFRDAVFEQLGELRGRHGLAEIIALRFITLVGLKESNLGWRFDPLRNHSQPQASAHGDYRGHDGCLLGRDTDLADERLVDLKGVDGKLGQIAQTGVARTEIIDRELHPTRPEGLKDILCPLGILHQNAFGQLELQKFGIQAGILQDGE